MPRASVSLRALARAALAVLLPLLLPTLGASPSHARMQTDRLSIVTGQGERAFDIEIAETSEEKALGLMYRTALPDGKGMLFPYPAPQEITMWMHNTFIPLDMVFINADGTIHRIERWAEPQSDAIIASQGAVTAVLELAGGSADRLGIKPGDHVRYRLFGAGR